MGRLMYKLGTTWVNSMFSYKDQGTDTAYANAKTIGTDMVSCLFNTDFAPVADVWTNPDNTVIGDRAYSDDFEQAAELVSSAVRGFTDGGVVCCLKHFPGHGDTSTDTHEGAAVVSKSLDELREGELLPFKSGIEAGADMVMIGHITVTALDDVPATISKAVITELLRGDLGWDGVVITDSLDMGALAGYDNGEVCIRFLEAGGDIMLGIPDVEAALTALEAAVTDGRLTEQRMRRERPARAGPQNRARYNYVNQTAREPSAPARNADRTGRKPVGSCLTNCLGNGNITRLAGASGRNLRVREPVACEISASSSAG